MEIAKSLLEYFVAYELREKLVEQKIIDQAFMASRFRISNTNTFEDTAREFQFTEVDGHHVITSPTNNTHPTRVLPNRA
jgi:hypothetical protein